MLPPRGRSREGGEGSFADVFRLRMHVKMASSGFCPMEANGRRGEMRPDARPDTSQDIATDQMEERATQTPAST